MELQESITDADYICQLFAQAIGYTQFNLLSSLFGATDDFFSHESTTPEKSKEAVKRIEIIFDQIFCTLHKGIKSVSKKEQARAFIRFAVDVFNEFIGFEMLDDNEVSLDSVKSGVMERQNLSSKSSNQSSLPKEETMEVFADAIMQAGDAAEGSSGRSFLQLESELKPYGLPSIYNDSLKPLENVISRSRAFKAAKKSEADLPGSSNVSVTQDTPLKQPQGKESNATLLDHAATAPILPEPFPERARSGSKTMPSGVSPLEPVVARKLVVKRKAAADNDALTSRFPPPKKIPTPVPATSTGAEVIRLEDDDAAAMLERIMQEGNGQQRVVSQAHQNEATTPANRRLPKSPSFIRKKSSSNLHKQKVTKKLVEIAKSLAELELIDT